MMTDDNPFTYVKLVFQQFFPREWRYCLWYHTWKHFYDKHCVNVWVKLAVGPSKLIPPIRLPVNHEDGGMMFHEEVVTVANIYIDTLDTVILYFDWSQLLAGLVYYRSSVQLVCLKWKLIYKCFKKCYKCKVEFTMFSEYFLCRPVIKDRLVVLLIYQHSLLYTSIQAQNIHAWRKDNNIKLSRAKNSKNVSFNKLLGQV